MSHDLRDPNRKKQLLDKLMHLSHRAAQRLGRPAVLMEVCGTHTMAIAKSGIKQLLAGYLELRSGPGCPVCVTDWRDIDQIIAMAGSGQNLVIGTFGDMIRVPGTNSSLEIERAKGAEVEVFYSPTEAVNYAAQHPQKEMVFLGIGFETTTPAIALSVQLAKQKGLGNYSVFSVHKKVSPALYHLLEDGELTVDGLLLPGHVCTITGSKAFDFVAKDYGVPTVIAGFEQEDLLLSLYILLKQVAEGRAENINGYARLVREESNQKAMDLMAQCFYPADVSWRGFGLISQSGLLLRENLAQYDAAKRFPVAIPDTAPPEGCACGEVLKGKISPRECPLFAGACTPLQPIGPCMVSSEGACAAQFLYQ